MSNRCSSSGPRLPLCSLQQAAASGLGKAPSQGQVDSEGERVNRIAGPALCGSPHLYSGFRGDFISSKLLIKFHIYDQKIKSLDLSEIGFYEFGLRQLSQQLGARAV